jgi:hypothetical protein
VAEDLIGLGVHDQHDVTVHPPLRRRTAAKLIERAYIHAPTGHTTIA